MTQQRQLPSPLLFPVLLWCLGIGVARYAGLAGWLALCLAGAGIAGALLDRNLRGFFLLLFCFSLGALRYEAEQKPSRLDLVFARQDHIQQPAEFLATKLLSRSASLYEIRLQQLAGLKLRETLLLFSERKLELGQSYSALLEILPGKRDPVLDTYPARHRAYIRQNLKQLDSAPRFFPIAKWRVRLLTDLDAKLGERSGFAKALLFSDVEGKGDYREELRRSGMTHLIVVSGLHIWFIYGMCMIILNALLPRRLSELVFLVLITFYAALNHWSSSVLRSILMIGLYILARWRSIPLGGAQLLALSLLLITLAGPSQLFDIGLQLSYLSVGVILLALPHIAWIREKHLPAELLRLRLCKLLDLLLLNLAVGLAIMPVTLYYFGSASLNGIAGNLLGIPLTGVLLALGFMILFLPGGNLLSTAFAGSYALVLELFEKWMAAVAKLPFYLGDTWLSGWQLTGCAILVLLGLSMLKRLRVSWRNLPVAMLGLALMLLPPALRKQEGGIYVFDCGTADCILVNLADGTRLLVDSGPLYHDAQKSWAARKLLPWLKRRQPGKLDWMVLTHLDADHSGGFPDIAAAWKPRHLIVSDETLSDPKWQEWRQDGLLAGITIHAVRDTVSFQLAEARLKFLHPDRDFVPESSNAGSLLFRLDHQGKRYLFAGDVDISGEQYLLDKYPAELKADFLKAGHHGSSSSSSREFVRAVQPREVWITASERNRWGFPHPEALAAFRLYASSIRSTAGGTIYVPSAQKD